MSEEFSTHAQLFDLTGKRALVTGGTRGIGADDGPRTAAGRRPRGDQLAQGRRLRTSPGATCRDSATCRRFRPTCPATTNACGWPNSSPPDGEPLHILVNNAGATWGEPLETFPDSAWDKVLDLNLKSPFWMVQALLPALREAGTADDPARIINVGSIDGLRPSRLPVYSYGSSKAALHQLTRMLAHELGPQHITVNAVAPGPFQSKMMAATLDAFGDAIAASAPLRRIGRDDDMAGIAVFLASRAGAYLTGAVIPVDGGLATTASG